MYEHRYVTIQKGVATRGKPLEGADAVDDYVRELLNRRVAGKWTRGCSSYFDDA